MNPCLQQIDHRLEELKRDRTWLSEEANIKYKTIAAWWNFDRYPSFRDAERIADVLGVSMDYLATGREPSRRFEDPVIAEIIDYLEGLRSAELQQTYGMIKLARVIRLSDEAPSQREPASESKAV